MSQRKAFNFYLSFFEVFEELPNDKEKLAFIKALLNKQFYGEEPKLTGMAKFAYISQQQVINQQVEGWENKMKTTLSKGVSKGGSQGGSVQEEEKGEEKEQYVKLDFVKLLSFINQKTGRKFKTINKDVKRKYEARLKDGYTKQDILNAVINASNLQYHKDNGCQHLTPEFFSRATTLDKYGNEAKGNLIASFPDPVN